ncbi:MAG TPA: RHS repeat-associated core domain-containing protein, partial [Gemmataceae bacterium]
TVNFGTNPDGLDTHPGTVPTRSDTVLVTSLVYDPAGRVELVADPKGIFTQTFYDALGRTTQTVENYVDDVPSAADDKTTRFTYDGDDHLLTYTLVLPGTGNVQTTQYVYGVSGSAITSNDLLAAVYHPDKTTGAASSSEADTYTYNALGQTTGFTDRNGTAHAYSYDVLGRPTADAVTLASGSAVDGSVLRLETAYDTQGNASVLTSYDATSGGSVVNQVERLYNGLGQLKDDREAPGGAVGVATTWTVSYTYSEMAGGANHSRLELMAFGAVLPHDYGYGAAGSLDDRISRVARVDWYDYIEGITYLGLGTVVGRTFTNPGVSLTYVGTGTGDGGDQYTGLDRFGRVVDQRWVNSSSTDLVRYQYGYDRDGNRLYQEDLVNSAMSEVYAYDGLNQLTGFQRGTLNASKDGITGTPSRSQSWTTDAAGNFASVTTDGTGVSRTTNAQNEVTAVGSTSLAYDADGNTTADDQGHGLVYDAWNRLVRVTDGATVLAEYGYDALSRRISETHGGVANILIVSAADQVLAEGDGTNSALYFWDPTSADRPLLRVTGGSGAQAFALTGANGDVAAVVDATGAVQERYAYDPYGEVTFLTPAYVTESASAVGWKYLHQGLRLDAAVDLYDNRARAYSPTLMRFLQNDPIGFRAGDPNTYRYEADRPVDLLDPSGLQNARPGYDPLMLLPPEVNVTDPARFDLAPSAGGPSGRVTVSSIIEIADYLDKHMKKGQCLNRIQIGAHGGNGFLDRGDGGNPVLSLSTFKAAELYDRDPDAYPQFKKDAQTRDALRRIGRHLCPGGKIEFIGCSLLNPNDPSAVKFMDRLESIFGKGNVVAYDKPLIWDTSGDAVTEAEWYNRHPVRKFFHDIVEICGHMP